MGIMVNEMKIVGFCNPQQQLTIPKCENYVSAVVASLGGTLDAQMSLLGAETQLHGVGDGEPDDGAALPAKRSGSDR